MTINREHPLNSLQNYKNSMRYYIFFETFDVCYIYLIFTAHEQMNG